MGILCDTLIECLECGAVSVVPFDEIRRLYYNALGLEVPGTTLAEELDGLSSDDCPVVDMPEDVLKVERVLRLRNER